MKHLNNPSIMTPDRVESRIGTLEFTDGMPSQATLDRVYENLDFTHCPGRKTHPFEQKPVLAEKCHPPNDLLVSPNSPRGFSF